MLLHPIFESERYFLKVRVFVGQTVLKLGAVGDVTVDKEIGLPFAPETQPCARLGCVGFHIIAVQIQIGRSRPKSHLVGPILVNTIEW